MIKSLLKTVMVVGLIVLAARVLVPHALHLIVGTRSRELFLLSVIVLGLGTAWLMSLAGLSLALEPLSRAWSFLSRNIGIRRWLK